MSDGDSAVDRDDRPGHVPWLLGGNESNEPGNLLRLRVSILGRLDDWVPGWLVSGFAVVSLHMAQTLPIPPPGFDELPVEEKVHYVEALWDRIAAAPQEVSVPDWHRQLLRDRLAEYRNDPKTGRPWRDVRDELLRELAERRRTSGA